MTNNYEAPKLTHIGSVEALTAGMSTGVQSDRDFPAGTPIGQFTFS